MEFLKLMQERYATKVYDKSKSLSRDEVEKLKEIVRLTPSSINSQPWGFTFVTDLATKAKFADASYFNKEKIDDAQLLVVISRRTPIEAEEQWISDNLSEMAVDYYDKMLRGLMPEQKIAWFEKQIYIAVGVILAATAAMGLDSTPMEGIDSAEYDKLIGDDNYTSVVAVAVGHRAEHDFNQPNNTPKVRRNIEDVVREL